MHEEDEPKQMHATMMGAVFRTECPCGTLPSEVILWRFSSADTWDLFSKFSFLTRLFRCECNNATAESSAGKREHFRRLAAKTGVAFEVALLQHESVLP